MSTSGQCPIMSLGSRPRPLMEASLLGNLGSFSSGSTEARSCTSGDGENASNFTPTLRHCCKTIHVSLYLDIYTKCVQWSSGHKIGEDKTLKTDFIFTTKMYYDSSKDIFIIYEDTFRFAINSYLEIYLEICWEIWLLNKVTFSLFPFSTSTVHY